MNTTKKTAVLLLFGFCLIIQVSGQSNDTIVNKLVQYVSIVDHFSKNLPQEKVYLHFDNSTYYQGDDIWFSCYLVASGFHKTSTLSQTLYVELLNPGGEVIDKQILKVENGRCHGSFKLSKLPFYSGFYEVRAYTKYMLNFGEETIFSRTFAVYDKPTKPGAYEEKSLMKYGRGSYPVLRKAPVKEKAVTLKFFPEGGNLVAGVTSQVAFEATDAYGNPIEVSGQVIGENKETIVRFKSVHDGKGVFTYTPTKALSTQKNKADKFPQATLDYKEKKYTFDLPAVHPQGIVLKVDNLSSPDSIGVSVLSNNDTPSGIFGLVLLSGSYLHEYMMIDTSEGKPIDFRICKTNFPAGVLRLILFNSQGQILCDRLLFIHQTEKLNIQAKMDKKSYNPNEQINMQFALTERDTIPVETTFSVSVKDKQNDVKPDQDIQSNLLLMSEIKGYVHNPDYYFESNDSIHQRALDLLLMVQGWHRFNWAWVDDTKPFQLKHQPEKGIEINGQVVSFIRSIPKPNVKVSSLISQKDDSTKLFNSFTEYFVTDSLGRFSFNADVQGRWEMIFAVREKRKKKDYRTVLDKLFSPSPKQYRYTDLFSHIPNPEEDNPIVTDALLRAVNDSTAIAVPKINYDSVAKKGVQGKMLHLKEVVVKAKKHSKEKDILENRSKSLAYYDVYAEQDKVLDQGGVTEDFLGDFLVKKNKDFSWLYHGPDKILRYKTKLAFLVVDYKMTYREESFNTPKNLRAECVKSMYISEDERSIVNYVVPIEWKDPVEGPPSLYGCVVFIEIFPDWNSPTQPGKGVRKTWLDGYSQVKEFYSPNYSILPPEEDYRRTLYWNPSIKTDKDGKALIQFYNNSSCKSFSISAETITPRGVIGVLKK
ncbi:hypothetical protein [Paludibacter propionicigenes]|nr:hypothetical protein [Paludibacter propionicigenes]